MKSHFSQWFLQNLQNLLLPKCYFQQLISVISKVDVAVEDGDPADEILITAKKVNSDIIILGYKGYGKEGRFLLGSVTDKVVRHASVSVLVVR